jgi:hypothetical protein
VAGQECMFAYPPTLQDTVPGPERRDWYRRTSCGLCFGGTRREADNGGVWYNGMTRRRRVKILLRAEETLE